MRIEEEIYQPRFSSPQQKAALNLLFTGNWLHAQLHKVFKPYGITGQQYNILRILKGQLPASISASDIKARMLDQHPDVSRLLDRLIAKGLVKKKTCSRDKRATDVFITEAGVALLADISKHQKHLDNQLQLSAREAAQLSDLLDKARGT
jgi:DNA-binding MarR family transcriptional regulator